MATRPVTRAQLLKKLEAARDAINAADETIKGERPLVSAANALRHAILYLEAHPGSPGSNRGRDRE